MITNTPHKFAAAMMLAEPQSKLYHMYELIVTNIAVSGVPEDEARALVDEAMAENAEKIKKAFAESGMARRQREAALAAKADLDHLFGGMKL